MMVNRFVTVANVRAKLTVEISLFHMLCTDVDQHSRDVDCHVATELASECNTPLMFPRQTEYQK